MSDLRAEIMAILVEVQGAGLRWDRETADRLVAVARRIRPVRKGGRRG